MDSEKTEQPTAEGPRQEQIGADGKRGHRAELPPENLTAPDIDPESAPNEDDEEGRLPELTEETAEPVGEGLLATGHAAIENAVKLAPTSPGVYRMLNAANDVLYVGKAKNVRKRLSSYARANAPLPARILRMIAATVNVEIISTTTETEALLLEANLIKQLRPRFNVQLRDDKSFPYILITGDHWAPQILKHRGAQSRPGRYFGPFASAGAVNRTITALQRAFLIRSCTDGFFESRTRPCLLYQIRRCAGPCTREIDFPGYTELVREATDFLSGRSQAVKEELAGMMETASTELEFETAAVYRDRLAALSAIQSQQGINPRTVEEADVFAIHQEGGYSCVEVFFFRTGQNWGNRAYFPRAEKSFTPEEVLSSFLAQFYDDKPPPRLILLSHEIDEADLLADALTVKAGHKVEVSVPKRGEKKEMIAHALTNAREALGRKLADTVTQNRLLESLGTTLQLPRTPKRIEVYDNSHIQGTNAVGAMIVAGPEGFVKNQYRKFNIKSEGLTPGDDYGMMREVLERRFKRLLAPIDSAKAQEDKKADDSVPQCPDLVIIDGGRGQLNAVREIFQNLGLTQVSLMAVAKGPDRDAGRETLFMPDREAIKLEPRDPVLYFIQRLRDEAHRFVIGSHRKRRTKDIREAGLQEIPGIGPSRKRALLHHFGTLKEIERASIADLGRVPGVSAESARKIFEFLHYQPGSGGGKESHERRQRRVKAVDLGPAAVLEGRMNTATTRGTARGSLSVPNILTCARIAAIPVVIGCIYAQSIADGPLWLRWVAVAVFIAAGITDYLDGYYARIWNQQSAFGRMLDPIADKLLVASCLLMLAADGIIHGWSLWAAIVILCREILVSGLREYLAALRVSVPVTKLAKWKTTVQLVAIGFLLAGEAGDLVVPVVTEIGLLLLWISAIFTIYTGWDYFRHGIHHVLEEDEG